MDGSPANKAPFRDERHCPHCGDTHVHRWGKPSGSQRYRCRNCGRTFNALTGTACAGLRRPELWVDYRAAIVERLSIRKAARRCGIDPSTALRWRRRLSDPAPSPAATADIASSPATGPETVRREPVDFVEWAHAMRARGDDTSMSARLDGMFGLGPAGDKASAPAPSHAARPRRSAARSAKRPR